MDVWALLSLSFSACVCMGSCMCVGVCGCGKVLNELKEYATEVDVDFVRKAVRSIGRCAIKLEGAAERCISVLLDLIQTKVNYVVQEAIVVIKDIFRYGLPLQAGYPTEDLFLFLFFSFLLSCDLSVFTRLCG